MVDPYNSLRLALEADARSRAQRGLMTQAMRTGDTLPISGLGGASALDDAVVAGGGDRFINAARNASTRSGPGLMGRSNLTRAAGSTVVDQAVSSAASRAGTEVTKDAAEKGAKGLLGRAAAVPLERGLGGFLTRAGAQEGANGLVRFLGRPAVARGLAGGGATIAGGLVGLGVDQLNVGGEGSNWDAAASGAAGGATAGAIVGGPWGALAGAAIGGVGSVLMNELLPSQDEQKAKEASVEDRQLQLMQAAVGAGVSWRTAKALVDRSNAQTEMVATMQGADEGTRKQIAEENLLLLQQELMAQADAAFERTQAQQELEADPSYMDPEEQAVANAYTQALIGAYIKPYADMVVDSGSSAAASMEQLAGSSGYLGPILRNQAAMERSTSSQIAGNMMGAAMAEPWLQAARRQQSALDQQAQSMVSQALSAVQNQQVGMSGGTGGVDVNQLLAGL